MPERVGAAGVWGWWYEGVGAVGAVGVRVTRGAIGGSSAMVGYTLAFSAGMFLAIALTDLLPELHFHAHDRHKLSAALLTGLAVMWLTSRIGHGSSDDHDHQNAQVAPVTIPDVVQEDRRLAVQDDPPPDVPFTSREPLGPPRAP